MLADFDHFWEKPVIFSRICEFPLTILHILKPLVRSNNLIFFLLRGPTFRSDCEPPHNTKNSGSSISFEYLVQNGTLLNKGRLLKTAPNNGKKAFVFFKFFCYVITIQSFESPTSYFSGGIAISLACMVIQNN